MHQRKYKFQKFKCNFIVVKTDGSIAGAPVKFQATRSFQHPVSLLRVLVDDVNSKNSPWLSMLDKTTVERR